MQEKVSQLAKKYAPDIIAIRRHLHANPELSYQEFETSKFVQAKLTEFGIPFEIKATTGVVGLIKGKNPDSRIIALRADMDALPIQEENDIPFKSTKPGIMHACGHDVHTACLLGAARILNETKNEWEGTIKLIFQPGEEKNPGGASLMIKDGVLENPKPQAILAQHVSTVLEVGKFSFRAGKVMASADEIYITVKGKGGHAASPQLVIDPILISSHLIIALQQVISRNNNPFNSSVLSISAINGGNTTNVIPNEVKLMGTFRAMDEEWRFKAHELIKKITTNLVESMGGTVDVHIDVGYPCVNNNEVVNDKAMEAAKNYVGEKAVGITELRMGAEDFGYYAQQIPACFFRLGTMNKEKGYMNGVHTPTFMIDEDAIELGTGMMAWMGISIRP
jgi:hippurate hydrolase